MTTHHATVGTTPLAVVRPHIPDVSKLSRGEQGVEALQFARVYKMTFEQACDFLQVHSLGANPQPERDEISRLLLEADLVCRRDGVEFLEALALLRGATK